MLFHYCSGTTFLDIVKSKELWASDPLKMNDPDEVSCGIEIISDLFIRVFPECSKRLDPTNSIYLACSFSENGDLLSQWRAYGDDGAGFSLGVDREALTIANLGPGTGIGHPDFPHLGVPKFKISNVFYCKKDYTEHYLELMNNYKTVHGTPYEEQVSGTRLSEFLFIKELASASCLIKSDFYKDEQEVRVFNSISLEEAKGLSKIPVFAELADVRFRSTRFGIKSYMPVKLVGNETTALRKIVIGPNNQSSPDDVKLVLALNGFDDIEVVKSRGNYR